MCQCNIYFEHTLQKDNVFTWNQIKSVLSYNTRVSDKKMHSRSRWCAFHRNSKTLRAPNFRTPDRNCTIIFYGQTVGSFHGWSTDVRTTTQRHIDVFVAVIVHKLFICIGIQSNSAYLFIDHNDTVGQWWWRDKIISVHFFFF